MCVFTVSDYLFGVIYLCALIVFARCNCPMCLFLRVCLMFSTDMIDRYGCSMRGVNVFFSRILLDVFVLCVRSICLYDVSDLCVSSM